MARTTTLLPESASNLLEQVLLRWREGIISKADYYSEEVIMNQRASALWVRLKANRLAYTLSILLTLTVGILIGTVISYGREGPGQEDHPPMWPR